MNRKQRRAAEKSKEARTASAGNPVSRNVPTVGDLLADALSHHRAGRLDEAERRYLQILSVDDRHADSLHLLGLIAYRRGRHEIAVELINKALVRNSNVAAFHCNLGTILQDQEKLAEAVASYARSLALKPDFAEAHYNLGNALRGQRKLKEAVASYERALALKPDYAEAHNNLGNAFKDQGKLADATASYGRALALKPDYAEAHNNLGNAFKDQGKLAEAAASYARALALKPDYAEAHNNLGNALRDQGKPGEAAASYGRALALKPDYADTHYNLANAFKDQGKLPEAVASYGRALALKPDFAEAHYNLGIALHDQGKLTEAVASYQRALALQPDSAAAHYNLGIALNDQGKPAEAVASYDRALALKPDYAEALNNRGVALHQLKRFPEELSCYARALALEPDSAQAHSNEGWCNLLLGDLDRGWEKQEWRWQTKELAHTRRGFTQPQWDGSREVAGKTILLHAEQGFGDTIQFCRYAPLLEEYGARVILEVQPPLRGLISTLSSAILVVSKGEALPAFDMHCPLLSLPRAFGTRLATIPAATPYLHPVAQTVDAWDRRLGPRHGPRIGLAWSGNQTHRNDRNRSIPLNVLVPILDSIDGTFVSVQRDLREADAALLQERRDILHFGQELKDFADTAALVSNLDLIVSVDTSVAHLAGALAKPVWVLLPYIPDWRWLLDREDSPWYPTARLFRQDETRAWDGVLARLKGALRDPFGAP